jgi:pimeloyl-ACP methyl ester carboxylesterase
MRWVKRICLALGIVLLLAVAVLVGSSLLSLDWERRHSARTAVLPLLQAHQTDGLVRIEANGMTFRSRVYGLSNPGPGLVLLHGFPETSAMWEPLGVAAAASGYRVVAFDQRGYSPGARPKGASSYAALGLAQDVLAVADAVGFGRFHLVGHDWGCNVGWAVTIQNPDRVLSWSGLSIPHPATLLADVARDPPTYIKVFTAPWIPEVMLTFNDLSGLRNTYELATVEQRDEYLAVFSEPGALTAALNWYRAIPLSFEVLDELTPPIRTSTLFVYGTREMWVTPDYLERQREFVAAPYQEIELDAGHWLMQEQTEAVVAAVLAHLQRVDDARSSMDRRGHGRR